MACYSVQCPMSAAQDVENLLLQLSSRKLRLAVEPHQCLPSLHLAWPDLSDVLPDGGLPQGIVELSAPRALGGSTSVALAAVQAGQARSPSALCAWIDPENTLHAPGVVAGGVELARMLVVRPPRSQLGRVAVKVVSSGAFEVVVVDVDAVPGASLTLPSRSGRAGDGPSQGRRDLKRKPITSEVLVRKLALAAEGGGTTVLLLTDSARPRAVPWPVALRLELERRSRRDLVVRVAKDRRGRVGPAKTIRFHPITRAAS